MHVLATITYELASLILCSMTWQGARHIGEFLLDNYGPDSLAMLVDEGGKYCSLSGKAPL